MNMCVQPHKGVCGRTAVHKYSMNVFPWLVAILFCHYVGMRRLLFKGATKLLTRREFISHYYSFALQTCANCAIAYSAVLMFIWKLANYSVYCSRGYARGGIRKATQLTFLLTKWQSRLWKGSLSSVTRWRVKKVGILENTLALSHK